MNKGTTIRTNTIYISIPLRSSISSISKELIIPTDIDIFRIQIQFECPYQLTIPDGSYIPYVAVNGQMDDEENGIKLFPKLFWNGADITLLPSDILIFDRRNTDPARDQIYLTLYDSNQGISHKINILFEGYIP